MVYGVVQSHRPDELPTLPNDFEPKLRSTLYCRTLLPYDKKPYIIYETRSLIICRDREGIGLIYPGLWFPIFILIEESNNVDYWMSVLKTKDRVVKTRNDQTSRIRSFPLTKKVPCVVIKVT